MRKILLLHNTPKARRYFRRLQAGIQDLDLQTAPIGLRGGPALDPALQAEISAYTLKRKQVRDRIPSWRQQWLRQAHLRVGQWHFHSAACQIRQQQPHAIGVWGGQSIDARAALRAAAVLGVPAYTFECGLLPDTTTCDPRGVNADNSVPRQSAFYANYRQRTVLPERLLPRASRLQLDDEAKLPEDFIFVPFQVRLDSQVLLYSPWIRDMRHLFEVVTEAAREALHGSDIKLVFKQHPSCRQRYPELQRFADSDSRLLFANGNNTQDLLQRARGTITINSTVGIESLLLNRPVLSLGRACYDVPGVCSSATSIAGVIDWMQALRSDALPPAKHRAAFLHHLAGEYCIPGQHRNPGARHFAAIAQRLASHPDDAQSSVWIHDSALAA